MKTDSTTSFIKQNLREKESRLSHICTQKKDIVIWQKGVKGREKFQAVKLDKKNQKLFIKAYTSSSLVGKEVLYSFLLNNVNYFGKSTLAKEGANFILDCSTDMYKSERRENFRLLTYPHNYVECHIPVPQEELKHSKVIDMRIGLSQTGLFKNFLKLVDNQEEFIASKGFAKFRVLDISVAGMSFRVGEFEKKFVNVGEELEPIFLFFNNEEILIPKAKIRHIVRLVDSRGKAYKVGLEFIDVDTNIDEQLGRLINDSLRDFESDFEEFI